MASKEWLEIGGLIIHYCNQEGGGPFAFFYFKGKYLLKRRRNDLDDTEDILVTLIRWN